MCALVTGVQTCALPIYQIAADARCALGPQENDLLRDLRHGQVPADRGHPGQSLHSIGWRRILALEWRLERPIGTRFLGSADARRHRVHPDAPRRGLERKRLRHVDDAALSRRLKRKAVDGIEGGVGRGVDDRSEEHTSELQSLMRISYAVFCLQKQKHETNNSDSSRRMTETERTNK